MNAHSFSDSPLRADAFIDRSARMASRLGGITMFGFSLAGLVYLLLG